MAKVATYSTQNVSNLTRNLFYEQQGGARRRQMPFGCSETQEMGAQLVDDIKEFVARAIQTGPFAAC